MALSVLNNNTMPPNSEPEMVIKSFDGGGTTGGTGDVVGGSVEAAQGIDGAVGVDGIDSVGCSSYCAWSGCAGTRGTGLSGAASAEFLFANFVHWSRVKCSRQCGSAPDGA